MEWWNGLEQWNGIVERWNGRIVEWWNHHNITQHARALVHAHTVISPRSRPAASSLDELAQGRRRWTSCVQCYIHYHILQVVAKKLQMTRSEWTFRQRIQILPSR